METTGLDPERDRIIEIFMLALSKSGEVAQYETLINPERPPVSYTHLDVYKRQGLVRRFVWGWAASG